MSPSRRWFSLLATKRVSGLKTPLATLLVLAACGGDGGTTRSPVDPTPGATIGAVRVAAATRGESITADRYVVRVGTRSATVVANGSVRVDSVPVGVQPVTIDSVPPNCSAANGASRSVTVAAGSTADVSFDITCTRDDTGALLPVVACPSLQPAASQGRPLQEIALGRVPTSLSGELIARVSTGAASATTFGLVTRGDDGDVTLIVPLHPEAFMAGGDATVRIGDRTRSCPPFAFRIAPLPPAPGEFDAVADAMQALIAQQAQALGTSVTALQQAGADTMPTLFLPLLIAQGALDAPDNPRSLRLLRAETDDTMRAVLDGLLALTGLRDTLAADLAAGAAGIRSATPSVSRAGPVRRTTAQRAVGGPVFAVGAADCPSPITDPRLLDACMDLARSAVFDKTSPTTKVANDIGTVLGLLGLVPNPATRGLALMVGSVQWVRQLIRDGTAGLLPTELRPLRIDARPTTFFEDQGGPGTWAASVEARSTGWALDEATLNGVLQLAGARQSLLGLYDDAELAKDLLGIVLNNRVQEAIKRATGGPDLLVIPPETFGPADISSEEWTRADIVTGTSVVTGIHSNYLARAVGVSQLRVQTLPGRFGGAFSSANTPIEVIPLRLRFTEGDATISRRLVRANREYVFAVRVEDSRHPEMIAIDPLPPGAGGVQTSYLGDGVTEVRYTAPSNLASLPFVLTARHTATTGARAFSDEPRVATVAILPLELRITPASACVKPGEQQAFTATLADEERRDATWTTTLGSIDANGVFTAPASAAAGAFADISARVVEDGEVLDATVRVSVGSCTCSGTLSLGAPISRSWEGLAGFSLNATGFRVGIIPGGTPAEQAAFPERRLNFSAAFLSAPGAGGFSVNLATLGGNLGPTSQIVGAIDPTDPGFTGAGQMSVTTFVAGEVMEGTITGSIRVVTATYDAGVVVPMQFTFRALFGTQFDRGTPFFQCYLDATTDGT